jgi:hypothetical protein
VQIEVVPEAMAEDESVWFCWPCRGEESFEPRNFCRIEWELEHHLDREVDVRLSACERVWVVGKDVRGAEDALDGAVFDVELFVAKAFASRSVTQVSNVES